MEKHYLSAKYYILALLFLTSFIVSAQSDKCAADEVHHEMMQKNAQYRQSTEDFEDLMQSADPGNLRAAAGTIYRIPVVFHIMHKGEAVGVGTNISDAAVQACVLRLNQMYRKVAGTKGAENASATDIEIEFALAVRDPNGNCTNGINRVNMSSNATYMTSGVYRNSAGITDTDLKATPNARWDQTKYYNIWVVYEIDNNENGSGIQGYAYFSGSHGQSFDGAVMINRTITNSGSITLPHELGHALNLYHTFDGDNNGTSCPANANCSTDGDRVCDTPPHIRSSDCSVGTNSCDGGTSTALHRNNYMDYSADACQNMFSAGQKPRMIAAITTTRKSFLASQGNLSLVPVSKAGVDFISNTSFGCSGTKVTFADKSTCIPNVYIVSDPFPNISFAWTVTNNAGITLTSTLQNPEFALTTAGNYDVTLSVANPAGTSSKTVTNMISIASSAIASTCKPVSTSTSTLSYGIYSVKLAGINHTSGSTSEDKASGFTDGNGYADLSCSQGTNLDANTTYTLTIGGAASTGLFEGVAAYIDYNNDGDFMDKGDTITVWKKHTGGKDSTVTFKTPASPATGKALRLRVVECKDTETLSPCMTTTRGQCHDFAVYFIPATTCTAPAVPTIAATKNPLCAGENLTLTASSTTSGVTYTWTKPANSTATSSGAVLSKTGVGSTEAGNYSVTATANGCTSASSAITTVVVNALPAVPTVAATKNPLCAGENLTLTASSTTSGVTYTWTKPANSTATSSGVVLSKTGVGSTEAGNYSARTTANGCTSASSAITTVVVNALPAVPTVAATKNPLCAGESLTLTANSSTSGATYTWTKPANSTAAASGAVLSKTSVGSTEAGNYSATATANGCTSASSSATTVVVNALPAVPTVAATKNPLCAGENLTLTASSTTSGVTYTWTKPANSTAAASGAVLSKTGVGSTEAGNYSATATANGCTSASSSATTVVINQVPAQASAISGMITPCIGNQDYAVTSVSGFTYLWSISAGGALMPSTTNVATVNWATVGGPYTVSVITSNNCGPAATASTLKVNVTVCTGNIDAGLSTPVQIWVNQPANSSDLLLHISEGTLSQYFSKVSVYSTNGVEVLTSSLSEALQTKILHVNSLQSGVYQVIVYSNTDKIPVLLRFVK